MENLDEIFEPMIGYEGIYEINRFGDIRTVPKILKTSNCVGYRHLILSKDGKQNTVRIHRALAIQFIPNPENKPYVNHKNCIKDDNRLENLEWCTQEENVQHAVENGKIGGYFKLNIDQVNEIRKSKSTQVELAKKFNVSQTAISQIKRGGSWLGK